MAQAKAIGHEKIDRIKLPCPVCKSKRYDRLIAINQTDSVCERCLYYYEKNGKILTALKGAESGI